MGIKDYLKHLKQENPEIKDRRYNYFYLDGNYLLHYLIYKCKNNNDLYVKVNDYIEYLFETIIINKEIYLVFDGEYISDDIKNNPKYLTHLERNKNKIKSDDYDKQHIYPKSKIIQTFKMFLQNTIEKNIKIHKMNCKIYFIDDQINGEADSKILEKIYFNNQDKICILSKDSDMILIAYSMIINKNIIIEILSNLRPIMFIDVNKLYNYSYDYVLIIFLLGNDYLPKISNVSYDNLLENYKKYKNHNNENIIIDKNINYENLIKFISYILLNGKRKIKYQFKNINIDRFEKYYNNLCWCLQEYKIINGEYNFIPTNSKSTINIYNFINYVI